jgi:putative copper resistance protein D
MMALEYWLLAGWIEKVMLYVAMASVIGGSFTYFLLSKYPQLRNTIINYMIFGAGIGVFSSLTSFFIQVGSFADNGLQGMIDPTFFKILLHSPVGTIQIIRTLCFSIIALLLIIEKYHLHPSPISPLSWFNRAVIALTSLVIVVTFSQLGHVTNLSIFAQILISIHIFVMSLWMGALFPLWKLSRTIQGMPLKDSMHLFGRIAAIIVGLLVICGLTVAIMLLNTQILLSTPYGYGFILKLVLVASILLLAAFNKWYFTPRLEHPQFAKQLSYAILFEMSLGLAILLVTGYITSVIGIA